MERMLKHIVLLGAVHTSAMAIRGDRIGDEHRDEPNAPKVFVNLNVQSGGVVRFKLRVGGGGTGDEKSKQPDGFGHDAPLPKPPSRLSANLNK